MVNQTVVGGLWQFSGSGAADRRTVQMLDAVCLPAAGKTAWRNFPRCCLGIKVLQAQSEALPVFYRSEDGVCLAADLRLDNCEFLEEELHLYGAPAEQLLLAAWKCWREDFVSRLQGGFAFALWDAGRSELILARDPAGERPLFYVHQQNFFAFCSMQTGLLALPEVSRALNREKIADFFVNLGDSLKQTYYQAIVQVAPAQILKVSTGKVSRRTYWTATGRAPLHPSDKRDDAEALRQVLTRATALRLGRGAVVGTHLSAGLDSSSVTACAAECLAGTKRELIAFTAVPRAELGLHTTRQGLADEGPEAAAIARELGNVTHISVESRGSGVLHAMRRLIDVSSAPCANVINLAWMQDILSVARERGIEVMLSGQAGNATISYEGTLGLRSMVRQGHWLQVLALSAGLRRHGELSLRELVLTAADGLLPNRIKRLLRPEFGPEKLLGLAVLQPAVVRQMNLEQRLRNAWFADMGTLEDERARFLSQLDLGSLNKALAALTGVVTLDPTADQRVYEFCFHVPVAQYLKGGRTRSLIRRAMRGRLPASVLERQSRGFQGADWHAILTDSLPEMRAELAALKRSPAVNEWLDVRYLGGLLDIWPREAPTAPAAVQHWHINLTRGLAMGYFLRTQ